ncbi:MAG TPA: Gfo/Idh/MocA family oxidoreductase [Oceanipulchritudo sp.]|nr:Gfo/Idh/MocA family oxidoreductase [Oceanipulchritudo sp.]
MSPIKRRTFLKNSLTAGAATLLVPGTSLLAARDPASRFRGPKRPEKLRIAFIGVGGRAQGQIKELAQSEILAAFCDVDEAHAGNMYKAFPEVPRYRDFRQMLDRHWKELDGVMISTPDHTHFVATIACMERGLPVFTEKPLTHNIWQARTLIKAADYYKVITAMGNQGHATEGIRYIKEWYDAGVLGEVREVLAWFDGPTIDGTYFKRPEVWPLPAAPVPATLDWDLWRGPVVEDVPYHPDMVPVKWRGHFVYGCAELGDWACHTLDGPNWALDLGAPVATELVQHETMFPTHYAPDNSLVRFEFAAKGKRPPVTLTWHDGGRKPENRPEWGLDELPNAGMIMVGSKASLMTGGRPNSPQLIPEATWLDFRKNPPPKTIPRIKGTHVKEWTNAIKGDGPMPGSSFAYGGKLTELSLVGVLAQRFGGRIEYDEANMRITNRPELNAYVKEPVRRGWEAGDNLWK